MGKVIAFLRLTRIDHGFMTAFAVFVGAISAKAIKNVLEKNMSLVLGITVAILVEMGVFIFNDVFNINEDRINDPNKPLVRGDISLTTAKIVGSFLLVVSLILSLLISLESFLVVYIATITSMLYNIKLKKTGLGGNVIVAFNTALPFYYGSIVVGKVYDEKILIFYTIAFTTALGREIIKGIRDIAGDKKSGIKTLPVVLGARNSGIIASIFILIAVALSILPLYYVKNVIGYLIPVILADILLLFTVVTMITSPTIDNAAKHRKITLLAMFFGILGFAFSNI